MHQNAPVSTQKSKKFSRKGHSSLPKSFPSGEGETPSPHPTPSVPSAKFSASTLAPSAKDRPVEREEGCGKFSRSKVGGMFQSERDCDRAPLWLSRGLDFGEQLAECDDQLFNRIRYNSSTSCTAYCCHHLPPPRTMICDPAIAINSYLDIIIVILWTVTLSHVFCTKTPTNRHRILLLVFF